MLWSNAQALAFLVFAACVAATMQACGFQPVYGPRSGMTAALNDVGIERLNGRVGQEVRNTLYEELTPGGTPRAPRYLLDIDIVEALEPVAIRRDASVTRFDYRLAVNFTLRDAQTRQALFSDSAEILTSANRLDQSEFASVIGVDDAKLRAARLIGQDISRRLSAYFVRSGARARQAQN
jgi:LPS-assembly lipoprotein